MNYSEERVNCPLCGSDQYHIYIEQAKELYNNLDAYFDVVQCEACGHFFTNPRPGRDFIHLFYPDEAKYYNPVKPASASGRRLKLINSVLNFGFGYRRMPAFPKYLTWPIFLLLKKKFEMLHIPRFVEQGKVLDIGCSWGNYLDRMREYGWDVYGTEINQKAVEYANENLGLSQVKQGFFEEMSFEENFFDAVNMSMVLEHIYEPLPMMQKVNSIMKPGGQLILSVPDISGFEAKVYKKYFYGLQVPEHLHHFNPDTIKTLLEKSGFQIEKIVHHQFDRDLIASSTYLENKTLSKFLHNRLIRKVVIRGFVTFLSLIGKTSRMSIYARKKR